jgi:hypothetical protein
MRASCFCFRSTQILFTRHFEKPNIGRRTLLSGLSEPPLDARKRFERSACENFSDKHKSIWFSNNHQLAGVTGFTQFSQ